MGGAFYKGLAEKFGHEMLAICDKNDEKMRLLGSKNCYEDPCEMINNVDAVLIAVKPQAFEELMEKITCYVKSNSKDNPESPLSNKLIISMMAGVPISKISEACGDASGAARVMRIMPNLGVQVGKGVTGWVGSKNITAEDRLFARKILEAVGSAVEVKDENMLDRLTSISGCGPAYFFYLCELLTKKARTLGFSDEEARIMAEGTFAGTAALVELGERGAEEWRNAVCSKGGSTERAIASFMDDNLEGLLGRGVDAAFARTNELNHGT